MPREITTHRSETPSVNDKRVIYAPDEKNFGYRIGVIGRDAVTDFDYALDFVSETMPDGLTNEVLIAVVLDRLEQLNVDQHACNENTEAISAMRSALLSLARRQARLHPPTRVRRARDGSMELDYTGCVRTYSRAYLADWGHWFAIEQTMKAWNSPPTDAEWAVLEMFADTTGGRRGLGEVRSSFGFAGMPVTVEVPALPPGTVVYDRVTKAAPGVLVLSHPGRHAYRFTADKLSVGDTAEAWATLRQELRGWKIPPTAAEVGEIRHLCKGEHALEQYRDLYRALFPGSYP